MIRFHRGGRTGSGTIRSRFGLNGGNKRDKQQHCSYYYGLINHICHCIGRSAATQLLRPEARETKQTPRECLNRDASHLC